jgi:transcriptional regulator with XRE-family HTH domain
MPRRNIIGERVRIARERVKPIITQADLAARLQVEGLHLERVTISKIETGYREVTDVEVRAIAKALGISVSWLLGEDEGTKSR